MKNSKTKLSQSFQRWLIVLVAIAFLATTAFLWLIQSRLSENNAINLLRLNLSDVREDIIDATDNHLLKLTRSIAQELDAQETITSSLLESLLAKYDVTEINVIDDRGIIVATTYPGFMHYDMRSGAQSAEFMVLLSGECESYVQSYQPVSFTESAEQRGATLKGGKFTQTGLGDAGSVFSRKYGGVVLAGGGFVQVGYGAERFQRDIDEFVIGVTRNRHVGEGGSLIVVDENWNIVSDRHGNEGNQLNVTGIRIDPAAQAENEAFVMDAYSQSSYCMYLSSEGYRIVAVMPCSEAALSRNVSVGVTTSMQIVVFAALFIMIFVLVKRLVVNNIYQINDSLSAITAGNLDTVVDVRSHVEFEDLSNDINSTVDTLKRYIADAAARIDAELAFARAARSLTSMLPCLPPRKWAATSTISTLSMRTRWPSWLRTYPARASRRPCS